MSRSSMHGAPASVSFSRIASMIAATFWHLFANSLLYVELCQCKRCSRRNRRAASFSLVSSSSCNPLIPAVEQKS